MVLWTNRLCYAEEGINDGRLQSGADRLQTGILVRRVAFSTCIEMDGSGSLDSYSDDYLVYCCFSSVLAKWPDKLLDL